LASLTHQCVATISFAHSSGSVAFYRPIIITRRHGNASQQQQQWRCYAVIGRQATACIMPVSVSSSLRLVCVLIHKVQ